MTISEDVELVKRVSDQTNIYRLDRGTTNMGVFQGVVTSVQEFYRVHSTIPTPEHILKTVPSTKASIAKILGSEGFAKSMEMRGIPLTSTAGLTPQQSILLTLLTNPADRRALSGKLKTAGVSYTQYRNWLKQPHFIAAVGRESEELLRVHTGDVLTQLTSKAVSGDLNAIKFYLEVNGRHDPNSKNNFDPQAIMAQILEIISRRVTDAETLSLIASDFEMLASGSSLAGVGGGSNGGSVVVVADTGPTWDTTPKSINSTPEPIRNEPKTPEEWLAKHSPAVGLNFDLPETPNLGD